MRAPSLRSIIILFNLFNFLSSFQASGSVEVGLASKYIKRLEKSLEEYREQEAAISADQARHRVPVPDASDKAVWSTYPELKPEGPIKLRIRVNIVLIGNQDEEDVLHQISERVPSLWLEYASGTLRHATLEQGPSSSEAKGLDEWRRSGSPGISPNDPGVEYAYEFRLTKVDNKVISVIEALLRRALREDDGESPDQGDADGKGGKRMYATTRDMDDLLGSLAGTLNEARWSSESDKTPLGGTAEGSEVFSPGAFTLFVLNPSRTLVGLKDGGVYGYRCGLSRSHMTAVAGDSSVCGHAKNTKREEEENYYVGEVLDAVEIKQSKQLAPIMSDGEHESEAVREEVRNEWREKVGLSKPCRERTRAQVTEVDAISESNSWADDHQYDSIDPWTLEQEIKRLLTQGTEDSPLHPATRRELLDVLVFCRRRDDEGPDGDSDSRGMSCLTDTWVSNERFAWVDLQAGPFEWGPSVGGIGYKQAPSGAIPHLSPSQATLGSDVDGGRGDAQRTEEAYKRRVDALKGILNGRVKVLNKIAKQTRCLADAGDARHEELRRRLSATTRPTACDDVLSQLEFLENLDYGGNFLETMTREEAVAGSEDLGGLRERYVKLLKDVVKIVAPATGDDVDGIEKPLDSTTQTFLVRLAEMISSLAGGLLTPVSTLPMTRPAHSTLERSTAVHIGHADGGRKGDSLSDPVLWNEPLWGFQTSRGTQPDQSPPRRLPVDLSQAMGRGIAAGGLTMKPKRSEEALKSRFGFGEVSGSGMGSAYPVLSPPPVSALSFFVPETLAYTFRVVYDCRNDKPLGEHGFDLAAFTAGALSLRLPNQRATFTTEFITLEDLSDGSKDSGAADLGFAVVSALAAAMRESNASVNVAGGSRREERIWIDSTSFYRQLRARGDIQQDEREESQGNPTYNAPKYPHHITVYLFSLAESKAVYVDEHWRARAVGGNMVIIAQSNATDTTTRFTCGRRGVEDDPRNPIQEALAALGSIVGGLVPSQDRWDEARGGVVPDWRWSMSESPMSPLVPRANFNQLDQDVIYRTHIVRALTASVQLTRAAKELLRDPLSRNDAQRILERNERERLKAVLNSIKLAEVHQNIIASYVEKMYFDSAARDLNLLLDESHRAYYESRALATEIFEAVLKKSDDANEGHRSGDFGVEAYPSWYRLAATVLMLILLAVLWGRSPSARSRRQLGGRQRRAVKVN